ncbi:MAG: hypothetical protein F6J93_03865 [Oscillatoria sp. SIO1A7]|nr:hypothetical protein [Oscillatoria sp. SIO1A7]
MPHSQLSIPMTDSQLWQTKLWQPQQLLADGRYFITGVLGGGGGSTFPPFPPFPHSPSPS